ncbi:MAG: presenilin family intramembrane aspartyl protease [Methanoculleus horonobensis]|nr:presenilin family intramembrane aspartyl protease [Methanoculleus horonobensis]
MQIRDWLPFLGMALMLLFVQIIAVILVTPMQAAGLVAFEDPESVANPLIFIGMLLAFTLVLLFLLRTGGRRFIAVFIGFALFMTFLYIFGALSLLLFGTTAAAAAGTLIGAVAATALLYLYPEWYVIDILGVLISAGVASIFGISLAVLPVIVLLVLLAVYDAISVYRTKHMITLAEGVLETKAPIMVVVPKRANYSLRKEGLNISGGEERGAFVMGMGDLIMPSILVVSSHVFVDAPAVLWTLSAPTLGAMAGALAGLAVLLYFVNKGNPQAGLPSLNGGAILGFLVGAALAGSFLWLPFGV